MKVLLKIFAFCTLCSPFLLTRSSPVHVLPGTFELKRTARDVFPDSTDRLPDHVTDIGIYQSNEQEVTTEKKEILKPVSSDSLSLVKMLHRSRRAQGSRYRYADQDDYYDDRDYAGYDRKGSDVGYMDKNDDFPTVVW